MNERFEREARTISSLNHPHICTLHDVGHQDRTGFLVLEFLEGETLERRLHKGPVPAKQMLEYGVQISDALDRAHRQGIVHRDLKPGNIMLTKSGVKLMDFGLATLVQEGSPVATAVDEMTAENKKLTVEGTIVGTFQYMAPEQLEGAEIDARTDISRSNRAFLNTLRLEAQFRVAYTMNCAHSRAEHSCLPVPLSEQSQSFCWKTQVRC